MRKSSIGGQRRLRMGGLLAAALAVGVCSPWTLPTAASSTFPRDTQHGDISQPAQQSEPAGAGLIAYTGSNPENPNRPEIFWIRTDGSHRRQLTTTGGHNPVWSPDGTRLAFVRGGAIWLLNAADGAQHRIVEGDKPAWSPDGERLSYTCTNSRDLCVLDLSTGIGSVVVERTEEWFAVGDSTWSPDGTSIAFTRYTEGDEYTAFRELFRVHPDGTELAPIPNTYPTATAPAWSPDGATILYTDRYDGRGGEGSGNLLSIRPDGTEQTQVTSLPGNDQDATWSADGQRLALYSDGGSWTHRFKNGIWTMPADGSSREFVVRDASEPSWRPHFSAPAAPLPEPPSPTSGPRIAYVAASNAGYDLFTVRPDGTGSRQLTNSGEVEHPAWSPDHSRIAYVTASDAVMWVKNVGNDTTRRVARTAGDSGRPAWSPNGRRLAWGTFDGVVVYNLQTDDRHRIPLRGCCFRDLSWSPDGRRLAFSQSGALLTVPARGGHARRVTGMAGREWFADWAPNGRRILFAHITGPWSDEVADVMSVRPDGTGVWRVVATPELDLTPAWSPNGQRIALYSDGTAPFGRAPLPGLWTVGPGGGSRELVLRDKSIVSVDW